MAEHELCDLVLGDERQQLFDDRLGPVRGDNGRKSSERQRAIGDRDAGVRVAVVDGHDLHKIAS